MLENGNLKHFNLADLMNILGQSKKTGELIINSREHPSTLYFQDGVLVHASSGPLSGEEVVYELMSYGSGDFSFNEKEIDISNSIGKNIDEIIREGSLRLEIINRLGKNSLKIDPNSVIHVTNDNPDNLEPEEENLFNLLKSNPDMTIIQLASRSSNYIDNLNTLMNKGIVEIQKSQDELFWEAFQVVIEYFYQEFTSISGLKMSKDLDKKIQDLIITNTWNLTFKDGKIDTNDLFSFPIDEQWKIYGVFLDELLGYFSKIYGSSFIDRVANTLLETNPALKTLLKKAKFID